MNVGVAVKVGVGRVEVIVLVQVGVMWIVAVADAAGGRTVGVGANNIAYEHPERNRQESEINRYIFMLRLLAQKVLTEPIVVLKAVFGSMAIAHKFVRTGQAKYFLVNASGETN
jgi:hypothetical protein